MSCEEKSGYYKTKNGKIYGPYYYERPPRKFTVKDIARLSKWMTRQGHASPIEIVAIVATAVGLGFLICKAAKVYRRITNFTDFLKGLALSTGIAWGVKALLQYLLKKPFLSFPIVDRIAYVVIAVLFFVYKIHEAVVHFAADHAFLNDVADILETGCDFVKKYTAESNVFDDIDFESIKDIEPPEFDFNFDFSDMSKRFNDVADLFEES